MEGGGDDADHEPSAAEYARTPPVILAAAASETCREAIDAALAARAPLSDVTRAVEAAGGLAAAADLSKHYADVAKEALAVLPHSTEREALFTMADYVSQEDQLGLQREKYIQARQKAH